MDLVLLNRINEEERAEKNKNKIIWRHILFGMKKCASRWLFRFYRYKREIKKKKAKYHRDKVILGDPLKLYTFSFDESFSLRMLFFNLFSFFYINFFFFLSLLLFARLVIVRFIGDAHWIDWTTSYITFVYCIVCYTGVYLTVFISPFLPFGQSRLDICITIDTYCLQKIIHIMPCFPFNSIPSIARTHVRKHTYYI